MEATKMIKRISAALLAAVLLAGCSTEEPVAGPQPVPGGDGALTVTMNIPTPHTVGTYAMNAKQECDIVTVDVLVFHPDGTFLYREEGTGISDGAADNKRYFSVKIKKTADPNNVTAFVYANVREQIDAALGDWLTVGTPKAQVIEKLVFDLPEDQTSEAQGGKWLVLPGRYTRFPMWGQTGTIDLTLATVSIPEVNMLRSVAKIDVGLAFPTTGTQAEQDAAAGLANFWLEETYLYNASDKLQVAPTNPTGTAVTAPSIPAETGVYGTADDPIAYARRSWNADGYKSFMSEIYLAEHVAGSDSDRPNNTCIVVGGRFGSQTADVTYYRIDLVKNTYDGTTGEVTAQEYLDVLRNHRYKVNITEVHGRGYDTPREAFDAMGLNTNLTVIITSQDERVTEIVYDGQYMLGMDRKEVNVDSRRHDGRQLYINTDYPGGWKATVSADAAAWLTVTTATGDDGGTLLSYDAAAFTGGTAPRAGTITIQAGRLFMDIQIIQSHIADIVFENLNYNDVYFMTGTNQIFTVKSNYNWKVRIEDEYNIVTEYDREGITNNTTGITYNFTLVDNYTMDIYSLNDRMAKLIFYSETNEFDSATVVIRGLIYFEIAGLQVYPIDQPRGGSWYGYAATTGLGCGALPRYDGNAWRLPYLTELDAISAAAREDDDAVTEKYNFNDTFQYWTQTTTGKNGYASMTVKTGAWQTADGVNGGGAYITTRSARCVRTI